MKWLIDGPLCAYDLETTGVDVETDRVVTACVALLKPGPAWVQDIRSWLVNPGIPIPDEATQVHGITTDFAQTNGEPAAHALEIIAYELARTMLARIPIIVCNGVFDFTLLDRELRRHDLPTVEERLGRPIAPVVDIYVLDKHVDPYRKGSRRLNDLRQHYAVRHDGAHDSTADALAAARVAYRIAQLAQNPQTARQRLEYLGANQRRIGEVPAKLTSLANMTAEALHRAQIGWRAEEQASLATYFEGKGKAHDGCRGDWPMIPLAPAQQEVPL